MRRLGVITGFLLLGVAVNLLVAWGAMLVWPGSARGLSPTEIRMLMADQPLVDWTQHSRIVADEFKGVARTRINLHYNASNQGNGIPLLGRLFKPFLVRESTGWPRRCLDAWIDETTTPKSIRDGFLVGTIAMPSAIRPVAFTCNSVFYGTFLWMLIAGLNRFRRWSRTRRRLCTDCGYDLRGAIHDRCPECGHAAIAAPVSSA